MAFPILGANTETAQYLIENSLRFDDGYTHLQKGQTGGTYGSAQGNAPISSQGNRQTFTISVWVKHSQVDTAGHYILMCRTPASGTTWGGMYFNGQRLYFYAEASGSGHYNLNTNRLFRDPNAWYHIVVGVDTTQGTASDRIKIYVNGVQETSFATETYPSQNDNTAFNDTGAHCIGAYSPWAIGGYPNDVGLNMFGGYLADFYMVDGTQLTPSSFGKFQKDGIWVPKDYSGSVGTNGWKLEFKNEPTSHSITAGGQTHHDTGQKKIGTSSLYFDGSDALTIPASKNFHFGTGPYTIEMWIKHSGQGGSKYLLYNATGTDNSTGMRLNLTSNDYVNMNEQVANSDIQTTGDVDTGDNAWHHIAISRPPGPYNTPSDDGFVEIYVDGTLDQKRSDNGYRNMNNRNDLIIGATAADGSNGYTGYIDEIRISNVARYLSNFTPSTSHFSDDANTVLLLQSNTTDGSTVFRDSSGIAFGLGADSSGEGNHWEMKEVDEHDQTTDTPTNNWCTLNPYLANSQLNSTPSHGIREGNCKLISTVAGNTNYLGCWSSIGAKNGKWYAEFRVDSELYSTLTTDATTLIGGGSGNYKPGDQNHNVAITGFCHWWLDHTDKRVVNDGNLGATAIGTIAQGDVISCMLNADEGKIWFKQNGTTRGSGTGYTFDTDTRNNQIFTGTGFMHFIPVVREVSGSIYGVISCNFGNPPYVVRSGNADQNGYGNFEYAPPSGYYAMNTQNLAEFG